MKKKLKKLRQWLCRFTGEDYDAILSSESTIQNYFAIVGLGVLSILALAFTSAVIFTEKLFDNVILDIIIGFIWGYVVTNLYVLLLFTISPILLPMKEVRRRKLIRLPQEFNASFIIRISLVLLLACISAQPINVYLFGSDDRSQFIYDIRNLNDGHKGALLINFISGIIFLLPIILKYKIKKFNIFYDLKTRQMMNLIESDYHESCKRYSTILEEKIRTRNKMSWNNLSPLLMQLKKINSDSYRSHLAEIKSHLVDEQITKYEYWSDPPYRTIHKDRRKTYRPKHQLLQKIYSETR